MEKIKVTVWLSTYNQEPYVAQALDSILMQKTDFPFEIIAADDCSTDRTQEIILDYQKRYPEKIITYFTPENIGGCRKLIGCLDSGLFRGDFITYLEGDDYWLREDRLQSLVSFLESNPEYSRVSHRRKITDAKGFDCGYDIPEQVLDKPFTIDDFLAGKNYSDFGSLFRNYFRDAKNKYHPLFLASRNVCDFQDMFITQDYGPVYVMSECFGVYRMQNSPTASNYNSITSYAQRRQENIRLARAVENFYHGKYDLSNMIWRNQYQLIQEALEQRDSKQIKDAFSTFHGKDRRKVLPALLYYQIRTKQFGNARFLMSFINGYELPGLVFGAALNGLQRLKRKMLGGTSDANRRGYRR